MGPQIGRVSSRVTQAVGCEGSDIAGRLNSGNDIHFLLGIFSVNLRKAENLAEGHQGEDDAVFAPSALEFFAYGVPLGRAVSSSSDCP
jgi:hypothetical protein